MRSDKKEELKEKFIDLYLQGKTMQEIASVYKCNELLKSKVDKRPKEVNNVEEIIQAIVYLTNKIDERKAEYFITKDSIPSFIPSLKPI